MKRSWPNNAPQWVQSAVFLFLAVLPWLLVMVLDAVYLR